MTKNNLLVAIARYAQSVHNALEQETDHGNRPHYVGHLAMAARMFKNLHLAQPLEELELIYGIESKAHFIPQLPGEIAATTREAWQALAHELAAFIEQEKGRAG